MRPKADHFCRLLHLILGDFWPQTAPIPLIVSFANKVSQEKGFREGSVSYLFRLQSRDVREAGTRLYHDIIRVAGERFAELEEDEHPLTSDEEIGIPWDPEDLAKIQVEEQIAEEAYYSRYGYEQDEG